MRRIGMIGVFLAACGGPVKTDDAGPGPDATLGDVTVEPERIADVLTNPNMGFADFHFGWVCNLPPISFTPEECAARDQSSWPENYPDSAVAYFRWTWKDLEPVRGEIDFAMIDTAIQSANLMGETLGFRVMTIQEGTNGVPDWLLQAPYSAPGLYFDGTFWPDYGSAAFSDEHERFLTALGERYDGHPAIDHIDIGTVGCWGEWNTACLTGPTSIIEIYSPADDAERDGIADAYTTLIDQSVRAFPETPKVMLALGEPGREAAIHAHALEEGAGWRVDCWGDWGWFSPSWSHQDDLYPEFIANLTAIYPAFPDVWKTAPIHLEVCGTIQGWYDRGWTATAPDGEVYKSFQWAIEQHASVLNGKRGTIPADYLPAMNDLLVANGYRYAIDRFNHSSTVAVGGPMQFVTVWSNLGVTPSYTRRTLAYRLVGATTVTFESTTTDVRTWLPGTFETIDSFTVPSDLAPGTYQIELAILDRAGENPATAALPPLQLATAGRAADGWYPLSSLTVE